MNRISSKSYRDGAQGQPCTLRLPGCTGGGEDTVFCHLRDKHAGGAIKASDLSGCDGCQECHDRMDRRRKMLDGGLISDTEWDFYALRALQATIERRVEQGLLILPPDATRDAPHVKAQAGFDRPAANAEIDQADPVSGLPEGSSTDAEPTVYQEGKMTLIPDEAIESHIGILGKTGSGKSNLAKVLAEKLMHKGERVCAIDPTGTWWGLRLEAGGKKPSLFKPVIFGGDHGDISIGEQHGTVLGEAIGVSADSAIIDTQQMRVGERVRFATDFAEALLRANRGPLHLIVDEAHLFAPQGKVNDPQSGKMLGAFNNLISLGRGRGLRIILISQRPAKLAKDSLTQVETLIAMRLIAPQDRNAVKDWIGEWADADKGKEIIASLPSLARGDAWVWSPQINYLERKHFPLAATFDSGTAEANSSARELPSIDTAALGDKMDAIRQEAQANDPKRLKARIAELERISSQKAPEVDVRAIREESYGMGLEAGRKEGYSEGFADGSANEANRLGKAVLDFAADFALLTAGSAPYQPRQVSTIPPKVHMAAKPAPKVANGSAGPKIVAQDAAMGAERKPLAILARIYPGGYTEAQWATLAGFKRTGGTWGTYKSRLRTAGRIEQRGDLWHATEQGAADVGESDPMPEAGLELVEFWCGRIGAENKFLRHLAGIYPSARTRDELADHFEMTASGGTFGTYLSRLRSNGLIEEDARGLRVSPNLMGFDA